MGTPNPIPLSIGTYTALDPRAGSKRIVGCLVEPTEQTNQGDFKSQYNPAFLRRYAGIRTLYTDGSNFPVRGAWEMGGVEYVVIGPNLYSLSVDPITQNATAIQLNGATPITGNTFVRMADNGSCLTILQPGTTNMWLYAPDGVVTFQQVTNPSVTATVTAGSASISATNSFEANDPVVFSGSFASVTGLTAGTTYFVSATGLSGSTFEVSSTVGGSVITPGGTGSATPTVTGGNYANFFAMGGALDVWYCDTYMVFLAANGNTFFNDDGKLVSGVNAITFVWSTGNEQFTREFGTDLFVGGCNDHREILLFGTRTTEGYVTFQTTSGSPFTSAADSFMEIGCHPLCGYTIAKQDQAVMWVANDLTIRRRNGQTPTRISTSGIEQILAQIASPNGNSGSLLGAYALTPTVSGHPLWVLQLPNAISPEGMRGRSLVYDCLSQEWSELASYQPNGTPLGMWRVLCYHNGVGGQLVGDMLTSQIGILDTTIFQEFGSPMLCEWTFNSLYNGHQRFTLRRVEAVVTPGNGTSQTAAPTIDLLISRDGLTYESTQDLQTTGLPGEGDHRAVWWGLGQFRDCYLKNRITDPTEVFTVDAQATIEPGYL